MIDSSIVSMEERSMQILFRNLRYFLRQLIHNPEFTLTALSKA